MAVSLKMTTHSRHQILEDLIGWTYQQSGASQFVTILQKYARHETATAEVIRWPLKRAVAKWGTQATNAALKECIPRCDYKAYWHRIAARDSNTHRRYGPCDRLTKYLKHPGRNTTFEEHVRLLRYTNELRLVPKAKLAKYRAAAYTTWGRAQVKWAWRHAELQKP
jgi:hypothetical protein